MSSGKPSSFVVFRTSVLSCLCLEPHVTGPKSVSHDSGVIPVSHGNREGRLAESHCVQKRNCSDELFLLVVFEMLC